MKNIDTERDAFEDWAKGEGYFFEKREVAKSYISARTYHAWKGWLARAKAGGGVACKLPHGYLVIRHPFHWSRDENKAWCLAIPDLGKAFTDLASATPSPPKEDGE